MNKAMMIVTSVSLAAALLAGPTHAAFPALTKIYRFTGIVNKPNPPVLYPAQTVIQCTNWSPNAAQIQIITYDGDTGATLTGPVYPLAHLRTITVVTSPHQHLWKSVLSARPEHANGAVAGRQHGDTRDGTAGALRCQTGAVFSPDHHRRIIVSHQFTKRR